MNVTRSIIKISDGRIVSDELNNSPRNAETELNKLVKEVKNEN
jgi:hypothetical protein